jgi:N-acetylglucosaminyl-diphospho-decaprenol L-rhamnosyltransferase
METRLAHVRGGGQPLFLHCAKDNLGYGGGINLGLDCIATSSNWSWVWILNPDTEVDRDALAALVSYARDDRYGIVGARLVLAETGRIQLYGGRWRSWLARGFNLGLGAPGDARPETDVIERQLDYISGASMFVSRRFIETVGRPSEGYFLYDEDVDWCLRRGSFPLGYAHDAIVRHRHGATIGSSHNRIRRSGLSVYLDERNKVLLTQRFFPIRYPVVIVVALLLTGQYILAGAYANFGYAVRGWAAGILGRSGPPPWLRRRDAAGPVVANGNTESGPEPAPMSE